MNSCSPTQSATETTVETTCQTTQTTTQTTDNTSQTVTQNNTQTVTQTPVQTVEDPVVTAAKLGVARDILVNLLSESSLTPNNLLRPETVDLVMDAYTQIYCRLNLLTSKNILHDRQHNREI